MQGFYATGSEPGGSYGLEGSDSTTISAAAAVASAAGPGALVSQSSMIATTAGAASGDQGIAIVLTTGIAQIACEVGTAAAYGFTANIQSAMTIQCAVGIAAGIGSLASVTNINFARAPAGFGYAGKRTVRQSRPVQTQRNFR